MSKALVLDGHLKSSLCAVRVLGKSGAEVVVAAERSSAAALHSRYAKSTFVYTSPKDSQEQFVADLRKFAAAEFSRTGKKLVAYCFSDATYLSVARNYDELKEWMVMLLPSADNMEIAFSKDSTYQLAQKLSIPTIKTYTLDERFSIDYPAVVKNTHSVTWQEGESASGTASFVFSADGLNIEYETIKNSAGEAPLIQEFIAGDEYGVEMMCDAGEIVAEFAHKRIRSLSPRGGAAVVKETAAHTSEVKLMKNYARELVEALSWSGPMMVEFKLDERDGSVKLMEINGRFWGSLPLPQKAGVDFVGDYWQLASQSKQQLTQTAAALPVRTRHFLGDLKWLWGVMFNHDQLRSTLYPNRFKAFVQFKLEIFRSQGDVWDWRDPLPSLWEVIDVIKK